MYQVWDILTQSIYIIQNIMCIFTKDRGITSKSLREWTSSKMKKKNLLKYCIGKWKNVSWFGAVPYYIIKEYKLYVYLD